MFLLPFTPSKVRTVCLRDEAQGKWTSVSGAGATWKQAAYTGHGVWSYARCQAHRHWDPFVLPDAIVISIMTIRSLWKFPSLMPRSPLSLSVIWIVCILVSPMISIQQILPILRSRDSRWIRESLCPLGTVCLVGDNETWQERPVKGCKESPGMGVKTCTMALERVAFELRCEKQASRVKKGGTGIQTENVQAHRKSGRGAGGFGETSWSWELLRVLFDLSCRQ